jgi:hypothetical protein
LPGDQVQLFSGRSVKAEGLNHRSLGASPQEFVPRGTPTSLKGLFTAARALIDAVLERLSAGFLPSKLISEAGNGTLGVTR